MAFNQAQIDELNKLEGFEEGFSKGQKISAGAMGDIALVLIPGGGIIKIGRVGSKLASAAYKRLVNAFGSKVKLIKKPSAAQVKKAQPPSTVLKADGTPKANVTLKSPQQVATNRLSGQGARVRQQRRKPRNNTETVEKVPPKPAAPGLKKNRQRVDGGSNKPKPKPNVKSTRTLAEDVRAAAQKRAVQQRISTAKKVGKPAAVAAGLGAGAVALNKATKPKPSAAGTKKRATPRGMADRKTATTPRNVRGGAGPTTRGGIRGTERNARGGGGPTTRGSRKPKSVRDLEAMRGSRATSPATRGSRKPKSVRDLEALQKPRASGPSTRGGAKRGATARITAGPNVGFGPKGNIFPKDAADRRRLMAKYGGTGSAAARAAAQGKQGNMKKGSK